MHMHMGMGIGIGMRMGTPIGWRCERMGMGVGRRMSADTGGCVGRKAGIRALGQGSAVIATIRSGAVLTSRSKQ